MARGSFQFRKILRRLPARGGAIGRLLVRGVDGGGRVGYGEVAPWPGFPTETLETAERVLAAAGGDLGALRERVGRGDSPLPCLGAALSMIEEWDDLAGYGGELNCAGLLGEAEGATRAAELAAQGYACLKAKVRPGEGLDRVRGIVAATPGSVSLRLDANGRLGVGEARELLEWARGEPRVEFVEQPLAPGDPGFAELGTEKVALDESFLCRGSLAPEAEGWRGFLVVKPAMAGNWGELRALLGRIPAERVAVSSCFETAVGFQAGLAFAARMGTPRAVGFGTLGSDEGWERHAAGPRARGRTDIDWEGLWARAA